MTPARDDHEAYYERAAWPRGETVQDPNDPARRGTLVRRCARLWVDRERKPPLVRWHGTTDAVPVPWYGLRRLNGAGVCDQAPDHSAHREPVPCTGLTARWCPVHGDCACPREPDGGGNMSDPGCPLHAPTSDHAEESSHG